MRRESADHAAGKESDMKGKMPAKLFRVDRWQRKTKIVVSIVLLVLIVVGILSTMMPTREEMLAALAHFHLSS